MSDEYTMAVARTIVAQIGGNRALAMIGAHQVLAIEIGVRIKFHAKAKEINGVRPNIIEIHLDPSDTYTLKFFRAELASVNCTELKVITNLYNNQLKPIIEEETCLYLSL